MSTMPAFEGGNLPVARTLAFGRVRESIDPDDFRGGFAVWSGTSFAAPLMAGVLATGLLERLTGSSSPAAATSTETVETAVRRAWDVVEGLTPIRC